MASAGLSVGGGLTGLLKDGYKHMSGTDQAVIKNIEACVEFAKITCSSMGPNGMNKMVINHLEKLFVTSDAATIVSELEVAHPAASMLAMASKMQEQQYGDQTNFVIAFAGELLANARVLLLQGIHSADIISGYKAALAFTLDELEKCCCHTVTDLRNQDELKKAITAVVASKHYGSEDFLAGLVADASQIVFPAKGKKPYLSTDRVRVSKHHGGNVLQSRVIKGMVVMRQSFGSRTSVENAKVAVFGTAIEAAATEAKGTVLLNDAEELLNYNKSEEQMMEDNIKAIKDSGVDVIIAGGAVSEMAQHFIERYKMMAIKILSKFELRRMVDTVGATAVLRVGAVMPDEMGHCDHVRREEIGGKTCVIFQQDKEESAIATIALRASTSNLLDDLERAIDDGVHTVRTLCKDGRVLPGGGAVEIELAGRVKSLGERTPGLEQYAIEKFAQAFEVIPRTLAENAGMDPSVVLSNMYAAHKKGEISTGVDINGAYGKNSSVADMHAANIYDPYKTKWEAIRLAADAALTVLSVDQIIMSKAAGGAKRAGQ